MVVHLFISLLLTFTLMSTTIEGRVLLSDTHDNLSTTNLPQITKEEKVKMVREIGSRPPRCEGRCRSCGHCEAIQVPTISISISNIDYKPITWKCKCGTSLFNP